MNGAGFVSGFVSILGRPNAGKSTLLNALVGAKLAIVTRTPQTTRTLVQGVLNLPGAQVIFVDTPGIHQPDSFFNQRMMEAVRTALQERDLLVYVADAVRPFGAEDGEAVEVLRAARAPIVLALNKIDRLHDKSALLPLIEQYKLLHGFADYLPISALTGEGLKELRAAIVERLPEGPEYFPPEHLTDQPERFLAAELIREKVMQVTREEVPHAVAVLVDRWEETPRLTRIAATIYVEREGQKGIVIGAGGELLKRAGTAARQEVETLLGRKVFLELFVKVRPHWRDNPQMLAALDWRSMVGGSVAE
ncbi:MAG: GTPase Era [Acidobacteria bacterium]|nr:GTPase Era [Acidobacteriota bacterium]